MLNDLLRDYLEAIAANTPYTDKLKEFFEFLLRSVCSIKKSYLTRKRLTLENISGIQTERRATVSSADSYQPTKLVVCNSSRTAEFTSGFQSMLFVLSLFMFSLITPCSTSSGLINHKQLITFSWNSKSQLRYELQYIYPMLYTHLYLNYFCFFRLGFFCFF